MIVGLDIYQPVHTNRYVKHVRRVNSRRLTLQSHVRNAVEVHTKTWKVHLLANYVKRVLLWTNQPWVLLYALHVLEVDIQQRMVLPHVNCVHPENTNPSLDRHHVWCATKTRTQMK